MNPNIKQITDTSFEQQVLQSPVPVLVDYWAEWCGPCKMIAPILDESAHTYAGRLEIAKVNVAKVVAKTDPEHFFQLAGTRE